MNAAYQAALEVAAAQYDPKALSARNEREGLVAARLAREWADELTWITREYLGHLQTEREHIIAAHAQHRLDDLKHEIGARNFRAAVKAFVKARDLA